MSEPSGHGPQHHDDALPEPQTPLWLPALGVALFVLVALWFATRPASAPPADNNAAASASAASSGAPPPAPAPH